MEILIGIRHWLYLGIGEGLGSVAGGDHRVVWVAMATAILFGAVHALMPGDLEVPVAATALRHL